MKIGIDARPLSYQLTGIGYYLKHLLDEIQQIDRENSYYLFSNRKINYRINRPSSWHKVEGNIYRKLLSTAWFQANVPLLALKNKIDLFWGTRHHLPLLLPQKIKTVLTICDLVHCRYPKTMALPNLMIERLLMQRSLIQSNAVISISHATTSDIYRFYRPPKNKITVIHPGTPLFPETETNELDKQFLSVLPENFFLAVGTIEPRKNFFRLLRAFELFFATNKNICLVIAGDKGWKNGALKKWIAARKINSKILFTGYINRNQLKFLYKKALCLVFPSIYEGFGFPILEAMSCGTSVITSNVSSMPEVAGNAAILIDPYNISEIRNAMNTIASDRKIRKRLINIGAERLKHFSWINSAQKTIKLFEKVGSN